MAAEIVMAATFKASEPVVAGRRVDEVLPAVEELLAPTPITPG